jgi:hypothetical protein
MMEKAEIITVEVSPYILAQGERAPCDRPGYAAVKDGAQVHVGRPIEPVRKG